MWTMDKFVSPSHAAKIFENFYAISGLGEAVIFPIAAAGIILVLLFLCGIQKKYSSGLVLILHTIVLRTIPDIL
jgi:putative oxidoreductase